MPESDILWNLSEEELKELQIDFYTPSKEVDPEDDIPY